MNNKVHAWPKPAGRADAPLPTPIVRPCDWGLKRVIGDMESQLGTIEAYNRLAIAAAALKSKIDAGKAEAQNQIFAKSITGSP